MTTARLREQLLSENKQNDQANTSFCKPACDCSGFGDAGGQLLGLSSIGGGLGGVVIGAKAGLTGGAILGTGAAGFFGVPLALLGLFQVANYAIGTFCIDQNQADNADHTNAPVQQV